jgi:hypothetical protein
MGQYLVLYPGLRRSPTSTVTDARYSAPGLHNQLPGISLVGPASLGRFMRYNPHSPTLPAASALRTARYTREQAVDGSDRCATTAEVQPLQLCRTWQRCWLLDLHLAEAGHELPLRPPQAGTTDLATRGGWHACNLARQNH